MDLINQVTDTFEKAWTPATRAGATVERVGKMCKSGVSSKVIACQLTENSPNGYTYTAQDVETLAKIAHDTKTRVLVTSTQSSALIKDQQQTSSGLNGCPA
jgi:hypothetical protein